MRRAVALLAALMCAAAVPASAADATAVLAGGCFWSMQTDMEKMPGAGATMPGYTGGSLPNPTYETSHDGAHPHVEALQVHYDNNIISYSDILMYYFKHIDPTDGGGQFCDRGAAYRPAIFYATPAEKAAAEAKKAEVAKALGMPVAVEILPAAPFWPAEEYHRDYARKNPLRYALYRKGCGRDARTAHVWSGK